MKLSTVTISPQTAAKWLEESNFSNRSVRRPWVSDLARDMAAGKWMLNGESIKFDVHNRLTDGQHRLMACVESGVSFETVVVREVAAGSYMTTDIGHTKKYADFLTPNGETNTILLSACARWLAILDLYGSIWKFRSFTPTVSEMDEALAKYPEIRDSIHFAAANKIIGIMPSIVALMHFVSVRSGDRELAEKFISRCKTGEGLWKDDPEFCLRKWLETKGSRTALKVTKEYTIAMFLKAWHMSRIDKKCGNGLRIRPDETWPELVLINPTKARVKEVA